MSNTPSSPVVLRIQQSALIFVLLVLALGALLLAANNIDPKASQRSGVTYVPWTSADGLISLEYPKGWQVASDHLTQIFTSSSDPNTLIELRLLGATQVEQVKTTANMPAPELATLVGALANPKTGAAGAITPVTIGALPGVLMHHTAQVAPAPVIATAAATAQPGVTPTTANVDEWLLALDPTHDLLVVAQYPAESATTYQPVGDHVVNAIHVQLASAIKAIDVAPTFTPTPTFTFTPSDTPTPTDTPTFTPTSTFTFTPSNTPTNTPTNTATNTPTNTATNTPVPPTNTPTFTPTFTPSNTPVPPTNTATNTPVPPTNTPTDTLIPPTNTPLPTDTPVPPTSTPTATTGSVSNEAAF